MQKIVFLDIDGPMIPTGMYLIDPLCSHNRQFSPISVAFVNRLCKLADAKIVTNTYHNSAGEQLKTDMIREGINPDFFHEKWFTLYPHGIRTVDEDYPDRLAAIEQWMEENGEADWICFDDADFTKATDRLILIDFDAGITGKDFNKACKIWSLKKILIL